jgi:hypothetical protein
MYSLKSSVLILAVAVTSLSLYHRTGAAETPSGLPAPTQPAASQPTSQPTILRVDDPKLLDHRGQYVQVTAHVFSAELTRSGKLLRILFRGGKDTGFNAIIFDRNLRAFKDTFGDDLTAAFKDATLEISGELSEYHEKPQIVLSYPQQLRILQPATRPTTPPTESPNNRDSKPDDRQ